MAFVRGGFTFTFSTVLFLIMLSSFARRASSTVILCFGDSWTYGNSNALKEQLVHHGHKDVQVVSIDKWGSTAEYFSQNTHELPIAVKKHNADYVLLSLGGNDFKNIYWKKRNYATTPWTAVSQIEQHLKTVLDALYKENPNIKVVTYGYDFPGNINDVLSGKFWSRSGNEDISGDMSTCTKMLLWAYNSVGIRFINYSAMQLGYSLEKLSKDYMKDGHSFTYVPLWGSLQEAAAKRDLAPAPLPSPSILVPSFTPRLAEPSPSQFMNDPIHANGKGYSILLGKLFDAYFKDALLTTAA